MAHDILAIQVSIVPFESIFSIAKKVISPMRSSLSPRIIKSLICLKDWLHARNGNFHKIFYLVIIVLFNINKVLNIYIYIYISQYHINI